MAKMMVITPTNLGSTIVKNGNNEANKWDVKLDKEHFEFLDGKGIHLKDSVLQPLKNAGVKEFVLQGSTLKLTKNDNTNITVDLSGLVPAAKADKFLKSVSYDSTSQKLKFNVGGTTGDDTQVEVSVSDLIPVTVGNGLEGNGTADNPVKLKLPANGVLKAETDGLKFDTTKLHELTDGTGNTVLGYIIPKAS